LDPDAEVLVRFCRLGFKFSLLGSLLDVVLLPMFYSGAGGAKEFNRFSLSNLRSGSPRFWGVILAAYVLTSGLAYLLLSEWSAFLKLRSSHLTRAAGGRSSGGAGAAQACRSVMVELIPPDFRDQDSVSGFFESLFGHGSVHSCVLAQADPSSRALLERALPTQARELMSRELAPAGQPMLPEDGGTSSPAAMRRTLQQQALGAVQVLQDVTIGRGASSTGFVTLKSVALAVEAQQVRLSQTHAWQVWAAPEPRDIIWENVHKPLPQVRLRHTLALFACGFGLIFWSVPVTLIQGWAQVGNLQSRFPFVAQLQSLPLVYSFLTDYLPVLALIGLQCVLPSLFEFAAVRYEGHKTKSTVQRIVLNRCFGYQLASLCVTMITGSIWIELQNILQSPASFLTLLSSSLPKVAVYFVTFVLTRTGFSLPLLLLRPWDLLTGPPAAAVRCAYGSEAANAALVLVIGLTYSFIAPAILPVCALYFGFATVVYQWLFGYVYEPEFDGRGAFWYDLFNSVLLGLLLGSLALVALACVRATALQVAFLVPLPLGVAWFGYWCWKHLGKASKLVALADAVAADSLEGVPEASQELYSSPKRATSEEVASG